MGVLIAHGAEASRRSLARALTGLDVELTEAHDGTEALNALLSDQAPRVALVDWDLPQIEGPELCRLVRDFNVEHPPYVILLAGSAHRSQVSLGLDAGANDCVRTPVTTAELQARVEMARRFVELPWGQASAGSGCGRSGDMLTGVLGREAAIQRLDAELSRAQRERQELGIGILDVDGLARVTEGFGRAAGDALLQEIVRRAKELLRPYDVIGRLEAESLLIVVPHIGELDALDVMDRLRDAMAAEPFLHNERALDVTVSLGGATGREESAGELISRAQHALADARTAGPGGVAVGRNVVLEAVLVRD
jgi:two-component system, cell cycle response regulator